jgi:hypothetical protein
MAVLSPRFEEKTKQLPTHRWVLWYEDAANDQGGMAQDLADAMMSEVCTPNTARYQAWEGRAHNGTPHAEPFSTVISTLIKAMVGLPTAPKPEDHLQGLVAEHIWFVLASDSPEPNTLTIDGPTLSVTQQGADALVVIDDPAGLAFRLWEIKKHVGARPDGTVRRAYGQLGANAVQYLAQYSAAGALSADLRLAAFYGNMAEAWVDSKPEARAGVSVALPRTSSKPRAFSTFGRHFPDMADGLRLHGSLIAIQDYPAFCLAVRDALWKGL